MEDQSEPKQTGIDFVALAEGLEELREAMSAMVSGLVQDGFTDREARAIIAGVLGYKDKASGDE